MNTRFSPPLQGIVASVGSLFGLKSKDNGDIDDTKVLDVDEEGQVLYKEDIIQTVFEDL